MFAQGGLLSRTRTVAAGVYSGMVSVRFFGQKRVYLETIAAENVVGPIRLANTHFLPILAKRERVLPVIATLLSFHPFLAILCCFPVSYSTTRADQHGPQEQSTAKFRPGDGD